MTITARVLNHQIILPADLDVPEGAEVQVILPEPAAGNADGNPMAWMDKYVGALDTLPPDAAERHNELSHGRARQLP